MTKVKDNAERTDRVNAPARLPHAVMDEPSRLFKARKIIALLGEHRFKKARNLLEVGCGSGVISSELARLGGSGLSVTAVDVNDNRMISEGYEFLEVEGTSLPFKDEAFDIVISNHVIEHVGERPEQLHHLEELRRVMNPTGCVYLAVPNKWRLIEPHYKLPLLSWVPQRVADLYLRMAGRGDRYDCVPLSRLGATILFGEANFKSRELTIEAVRWTLRIEFPTSRIAAALANRLPSFVLVALKPVLSTLIFELKRTES